MLDTAAEKLDISARAYVRAVKVARTIADLDESKEILPVHISEALQYRRQSAFLDEAVYSRLLHLCVPPLFCYDYGTEF